MEIHLATGADPAAFCASDEAKLGVKKAVATTAGVSEDKVTVVLEPRERDATADATTAANATTAGRRLQGSLSRSLLGTESYVHVDSTIETNSQFAADTAKNSIQTIEGAAFSDSLRTGLAEAGMSDEDRTSFNPVVANISAPVVAEVARTPADTAASGTASGAIIRCHTSNVAFFFIASAWLASFSCLA